MKLPNGYGSVHKLPGKRRKPYRVRVTKGWEYVNKFTGETAGQDEDINNLKVKQIYFTIGYYETKKDALQALADYNEDPFDLHHETITFAEVYDKWSDVHFPKVSDSNVKGYKAAYNLCHQLYDVPLQQLKLDHFQRIVDESGKNTPTLKKLKILWGMMYDYAVMHEIVSQDKRDMIRYIDISQAGNPNAYNRKPFTDKEIKMVWDSVDSNEYMTVILILIYTGCRISELLDLKKENVHIEEKWFYIQESKTESGIREVPIADKVMPFFEHWMEKPCDYLICTPDNKHFDYRNYYDSYWKPMVDFLDLEHHRPHDTRHTCISKLTEAGVDDRIIKKIVGHKGQGVTETVYTHLYLPIKLEAINKI